MTEELSRLDAIAQAELVRSGEASPFELVEAAIERTERVNPQLNAVIHERFEKALSEARGPLPDGPLRGVPMVLKDLDGYSAGDPYHGGMKHLRDAGYVAPEDSYLTGRFRAAGLVFIGRTNVPELGLQTTTESEAYGPARNPWDTAHSTGGSSGGSAAAVASGMVPLGHAGDGGGSIRIPASECGLFGLKPSRGRVSVGPEVGEAWAGAVARLVVARSVRDTAAVLDAVNGPMPGDPYTAPPPARPYAEEVGGLDRPLRVGWTTTSPDPGVTTQPDCIEAVAKTVGHLEALGHHVEEAHPDVWDDPDYLAQVGTAFVTLIGVWTAADLDNIGRLTGKPVTSEGVEPGTWAAAEMGRASTGVQYLEAVTAMHGYGRRLAPFWSGGFDILVTPTIPEPPPTLGQFAATADNPLNGMFRAAAIVPFCSPFNLSGQPAASVPMHWTADGLPVGVQIVGGYGREDLLIGVASQLEEVAPWSDRVPPVYA